MVETGATRRVAMAQGLMTVEGSPDRYVQGLGRPLRIVAGGLRRVGGFALREGQVEDATRIEGLAQLGGDRLMRAGFPGEAASLALVVRPLAAAGEARALLILSFQETDERPEGGYLAEIYAPQRVFDGLASALADGQAETLAIIAVTSLWVRETERETPSGVPVSWFLGVDADGRASAPARGLVESLEWHPRSASEAAPRPETDEDPAEAASDLLARINWSLKQIALVLMFLLIVVALK